MQLSPADTPLPREHSPLRLALAAATGALLAAGSAAAQSGAAAPAAAAASAVSGSSAPGGPGSSRPAGATPASAAPTGASATTATAAAPAGRELPDWLPGFVAEALRGADWTADTALLVYQEAQGRVRAIEPMVALRRTDGDERTTSLRLTLDSLTGASPTGAVPQPVAQTLTSASGQSSYTVPAGQVPMDQSFKDLRGALNLAHERPLGEGRKLSLGFNASAESDFTSLGASLGLALDTADRNGTLSLGLAGEADRSDPQGGMPQALAPHDAAHRGGAARGRQVGDLLVGWTQVMSRRWLLQANLGYGASRGEHRDPYKVLSVVDGSTGLQTGDGLVSEARPERRRRHTAYLANKWHVGSGVVDLGLRAYRDDWGIRARSADLAWRHELGNGWALQPSWRHYRQSAASFYRPWLLEGVDYDSSTHQASIASASADPRLAAFTAQTLGLKLSRELGRGREFGVRLTHYRQQHEAIANAPGYLATVPLVDELRATTLFVGYTHLF